MAVPDQILTAPEHRRRGLGALVMRTLQSAGHEAGADTAVLVGTPDGRALYTSLGWTTRSSMASLVYEPRPCPPPRPQPEPGPEPSRAAARPASAAGRRRRSAR